MDFISPTYPAPTLLTLPSEIRLAILEQVLDDARPIFKQSTTLPGLLLDEGYTATKPLSLLLTCRQFYGDASLLALNKTSFVVANRFASISERLRILHTKQLAALRDVTFVADARHFQQFADWGTSAFGIEGLRLDSLTVVLQRSNSWHYLFDYTPSIVHLLRRLQNTKSLTFVRNAALVKGSFKTWYNRLVGLIMKVDHHQRYILTPPEPEKVWWEWGYDEVGERICLEAGPARDPWGVEDEVGYLEGMKGRVEALRVSVEGEEYNWDPRSRNMYY